MLADLRRGAIECQLQPFEAPKRAGLLDIAIGGMPDRGRQSDPSVYRTVQERVLLVGSCRRRQSAGSPREGQRLKWVRALRLNDYPMPPADVPLVAMLRDLLG